MPTIDMAKLIKLQSNIESVLYGKSLAVRQALVALLAGGHLLLEDVPGVGKTVLARALARSIHCSFNRIQLTPDLLPSDILGVSVYHADTGQFVFKKGPIFANIVLADEINRTTPRTQSALLEAMNESQVTMDGQTYVLGPPFMVVATQNPFQFEGTYFLPENQLDRFMIRLRIGYPDKLIERRILAEQPGRVRLEHLQPVMSLEELIAMQKQVLTVRVDDAILDYIVSIAEATRRHELLSLGLSPRGALALTQATRAWALLQGRDYVIPDDVKDLAVPVMAHRLLMKSIAQDGFESTEAVVGKILQSLPAPQ
jgi:MoxR-like ATPase